MSIDPEILLGLNNSTQNSNSLELQREILAMQKLQVLNQVRLSQGLPPLAQPPKEPEEPDYYGITVLVFIIILVVGFIVFAVFSRIEENKTQKLRIKYENEEREQKEREYYQKNIEREQENKYPPLGRPAGGGG